MFPQENIVRDHWAYLILCFSTFIAASYENCGAPWRLDYAILESRFTDQENFQVNDNVTYNCVSGFIPIPETKNIIFCLNNSTWSKPEKFCQRRSCSTPGDIENGDVEYNNTLSGSRVYFTCHTGYTSLSKNNYRECQADGTWSNEVPVCEVQSCMPPYPITDGSLDPFKEEYTYRDTVKYQCREKKFALIGQPSAFCTAYGNWSSDPPKCVEVECPNPEVADAVKLSGFKGPYYLDFAVKFKCSPSFTMKGDNLVKCDVNSQWHPPLPTCYRNNVAAVMGNCIVILTMLVMGQVIHYHL